MPKRYQFVENFQDIRGYEYPVIADYGEEGPQPGKDAIRAWGIFRHGTKTWVEDFDPHDLLEWRENSAVLAEFDSLGAALSYLGSEVLGDIPPAPGWEEEA